MRIVHVITNFGAGGIENFVTQAAISQSSQHKVSIIALRDSDGKSARADSHKRKLFNAGIDVVCLGNSSVLGMLASAFALRRLLKKTSPDIVNAHSHRGVLLWVLGGGNKFGDLGRLVYTHHTTPILIRPFVFKWLDRSVIHYITNSKAGAKSLTAFTRKPVSIIYLGVEFPCAQSTSTVAKEGGSFVITTVGALRTEKRHDRIPKIASKLRASHPEVFKRTIFQIIGAGPCMLEIEAKIVELNLRDKVRLLGERTDVLKLLRNSDLFLLTSDYEGVPISLVEAGWACLPIVSANAGGCNEVISHGVEGYIVPVDDIDRYVSSIFRLAADAGLYKQMSMASGMIPSRFDMKYCLNEMNRVYEVVAQYGLALPTVNDLEGT